MELAGLEPAKSRVRCIAAASSIRAPRVRAAVHRPTDRDHRQFGVRDALPALRRHPDAAGAPLTDEIIQCQLKPLSRADYDVTFTDAEWAQPRQAFPTGVCDYRKP